MENVSDVPEEPQGTLPLVGDASRSRREPHFLQLRSECELFLFDEAALLDAWALDDWYALFTEDGRYVVPSTDDVYGDPDLGLALINETKDELNGRIQRLKSTWAHIENPHSRTSRLLSNVRIIGNEGAETRVTASFITHRSRPYQTTSYAGTVEYLLRRTGDDFRIVRKTVRLVHETLRDSGGVLSILL